MDYEDFIYSAVAVGPELGRAGERGVGETVLRAIQAARRVTQANTNLGIVLLFAPLAKAASQTHDSRPKTQVDAPLEANSAKSELRITNYALRIPPLRAALHPVLRSLTVADAVNAYAAIRLAIPGGLADRVERHDVRDEPAVTLLEAMTEAAGRDSIAAEYVKDYAITFGRGLPALETARAQGLRGRAAVTQTYLELLADVPDTLIARKRGQAVAEEVSQGARMVLRAGGMASEAGRQALADFDASLRDEANSLNPGATADLTAATLFAALLTGMDVRHE